MCSAHTGQSRARRYKQAKAAALRANSPRGAPRWHWRSYGNEPLPTGAEALDEPFAAFPSWFLRITFDRCGKVQMVNESHAGRWRDGSLHDILAEPPPRKRKEERLWGLDQVFPLAGQATTIHEQCRLGFVSVVRFSAGPYAFILKPPDYFERFPISEADFQTLEQELRATSLKRAR